MSFYVIGDIIMSYHTCYIVPDNAIIVTSVVVYRNSDALYRT